MTVSSMKFHAKTNFKARNIETNLPKKIDHHSKYKPYAFFISVTEVTEPILHRVGASRRTKRPEVHQTCQPVDIKSLLIVLSRFSDA